MKTYELKPIDGRKSFYGKAVVQVDGSGKETLYSYGTKIADKDPEGNITRFWAGWSQTTGRHIKAFCGMNKGEFESLPLPEKVHTMAADMTPAESYRAMIARRAAK